MIRTVFPALAALALAGCAGLPEAPTRATAELPSVSSVTFGPGTLPRGVPRSNDSLAEDFLDLTFALERGEALHGLLRHEGPVRVYVRSPELRAYNQDIENLLARFRSEAAIDIRTTTNEAAATIHIDGVTLRDLQRVDPGAACFIVPGETSWSSFRGKPSRARVRWSSQSRLGTTAIFIPTDTFPQDVRDCLHEELAQALGPANDLYRLPDSVFNDDNFHSIVTPFDMLMLRVLYSPELQSGMSRNLVANRIGTVLARINPDGAGRGSLPRAPASAEWKAAIETALTRRAGDAQRIAAANRAVTLAEAMSPPDHRLGVSLITRGRLTRETSPGTAARDFIAAYGQFRRFLGPDDLRTAQAALHVALVALSARDIDGALELAEGAIPVAERGQNAVLLSGLLAVKSTALTAKGDRTGARLAQLDHLRWARYAYGDGNGNRARVQAQLEQELPQAAN